MKRQATRQLWGCLLASALALGAAGAARAAENPKAQAARELFTEGKAKWASGEFEAAISLFSASLEQLPKASTFTLLADSYEHLGRLRSARDTFQRAAELARQAKNEQLAQVAHTREAALAPRIPQLEIRILTTSPGLRVTLNGVEVGPRWLNVPIPMDAGAYQLEARATGYVPSLTSVRLNNPSTQPATVQVVQVTLTPESARLKPQVQP